MTISIPSPVSKYTDSFHSTSSYLSEKLQENITVYFGNQMKPANMCQMKM